MRTFKVVLSGFFVASALMLAGEWGYRLLAGPAVSGETYFTTPATALIALLYTGASVVAGAYVATRIQDSPRTISGFLVAQAFFGFGLIRQFWYGGSSWYAVAALLLVIPCAIIGRRLGRRLSRNKLAEAA